MKDIFPGFHKKTDKELKALWEESIICFDANVLLNIYSYSSDTQKALLDLIDKLKEKIALPHQAALEYNRNRYDVISQQEVAYSDFLKKLNQMQTDMEATSKPPFLTSKVHKAMIKNFEEVKSEIDANLKIYNGYFSNDLIYKKLSQLFDQKITGEFTAEELKTVFSEGTTRFKDKIPPGYEDDKKPENRKFGDYIIWKQILNLSKNEDKSIILITDEKKADWWWKIGDGRIIGPRYELVDELKKISGNDFHMYSTERFLSFGQEILNVKVNTKAVDEIKQFNKFILRTDKDKIVNLENLSNDFLINNSDELWKTENLVDWKKMYKNQVLRSKYNSDLEPHRHKYIIWNDELNEGIEREIKPGEE